MYKSNVVMEWRRTGKGIAVLGSKCGKCSELCFPARLRCAKCGSNDLKSHKFAGTGKIFSFSKIFYPATTHEKYVPYTVAIIELDEGPKMTAQIVDCDNAEAGMKVESCVRKLYVDGESGIIHYGIKFRPAD